MVKMTCRIRLGLYRQKILIEGRNTPGKTPIEAYWYPIEKIPEFIADQEDVTKVFLIGPDEYLYNIESQYNDIISNRENYINNKEFIYWKE